MIENQIEQTLVIGLGYISIREFDLLALMSLSELYPEIQSVDEIDLTDRKVKAVILKYVAKRVKRWDDSPEITIGGCSI